MAHILVVDDERSIRHTLKDILEFEQHTVTVAEGAPQALQAVDKESFDLVLSDIKMPGMDGMELLEALMERTTDIPVVMLSGHGTIETAVEAIKRGAFDFIEKPIDLNRLLITVRNALDKGGLVVETKALKKKIGRKHRLIGCSPGIEKVRQLVERVAPTDARVLITGANGTGKEVVAHLLHLQSPRAGAPMVEVNCAAIPSELIESELFGHEKGAFTSAVKQRKGKFEQADGGTIFLDEIGDMSPAAQTKVLRVLQESEISRVGSDKTIKVDVRVVAATNKDLKSEIEKGHFREDLFHRLNVIPIHIPTLDERKEDIPLLVAHFSELICAEQGIPTRMFSPDAIEALRSRSWPGNIRELRNVVERLIILGGKQITADDVAAYA